MSRDSILHALVHIHHIHFELYKHHNVNELKEKYYVIQWRIQDFSDGERQPLSLGRKPIIWQNIHRKLHENERNWTEVGIRQNDLLFKMVLHI